MTPTKAPQALEILPAPNPVTIDLSSLVQDQRRPFIAMATYQDSSKSVVDAEWEIIIVAKFKTDASGLVASTRLRYVVQTAQFGGLTAVEILPAVEP